MKGVGSPNAEPSKSLFLDKVDSTGTHFRNSQMREYEPDGPVAGSPKQGNSQQPFKGRNQPPVNKFYSVDKVQKAKIMNYQTKTETPSKPVGVSVATVTSPIVPNRDINFSTTLNTIKKDGGSKPMTTSGESSLDHPNNAYE